MCNNPSEWLVLHVYSQSNKTNEFAIPFITFILFLTQWFAHLNYFIFALNFSNKNKENFKSSQE